jgi:conserved repeat domain
MRIRSAKTAIVLLLGILFLLPFCLQAEGSKNLFPSGGTTGNNNDAYRAELTSTTVSPDNYCGIINTGKHFVYAKNGETIYIGSSALGRNGSVKVTDPTGAVTTYISSTGAITTRAQELAGPKPLNMSGYTPITLSVNSSTQGVWTVEFLSSYSMADLNDANNAQHNLTANANWSSGNQPKPWPCIVAWDITVANGTTAIPGRVYINVFTGSLGGHDNGFYGKFYSLTPDGFQYCINNNGLAPFVFAFFSNNRGLEDYASGLAVFKSAANADISNYPLHSTTTYKFKDPTTADDAVNVTNKLFYNTPATDMPSSAAIYQGGATTTTWLYNAAIAATVTNLSLTGKEGQPFFSTGGLAGGLVNFTASSACRYKVNIDVNNNGSYTDAVDVTLTGEAASGSNSIVWDGKDGTGVAVPSGTKLTAKATLYSGEVHFPLSDAENNPYGTILQRLSDNDYTIYWNDTSLPGTGTDMSISGISSASGAHKWSTSAASGLATTNNTTTDFGDVNIIDTWAYTTTSVAVITTTVIIKPATDLKTTSITGSLSQACAGSATNVTYTVKVGNDGPGNVSAARFIFEVPVGVTINSVSGVVSGTGSTSKLSSGVNGSGNNEWRETVALNSGSSITYTISATIGAGVAAGTLTARASMLRETNVIDPDATNPDNGVPTDPVNECAAVDPAITCNNIKTNNITINPLPVVYSVTGGGICCSGSGGVAVGLSNSQSGVNYQLQLNGTNTGSPVGGTGAAISFGNQTTAGTYTVVATNPTTGCPASMTGSATVTVNPLPTAYSVTGGGSYCAGGSGVSIGLSGSQSGVNYQLQLNGANSGASVAGTGSAISFGNQISAGTYTVMATNTTTGCLTGMTGSVAITINSLPATPTISSAMLSNACPATTVNIASLVTSSTPSGCSILYKTTNDPAGIDVADPTKVGGGTYYIFYKNASGCSSYPAASVTVTIHSCNDLSITKAISDMNPLVGTDVTFTITAYNGSGSNATGVKVSDTLSPGYTYKSYSATTGTYDNTTGIWTIGTLGSNSSVTLTIIATVK